MWSSVTFNMRHRCIDHYFTSYWSYFYFIWYQRIGETSLRDQLLNDDCLSEQLIDEMIKKFLEQVRQGTWSSDQWPQMYTDYSVLKLAVNAYTRLTSRRLSDRPDGQKIYMNCFCPGWVKTAWLAGKGIFLLKKVLIQEYGWPYYPVNKVQMGSSLPRDVR